MPSESAHFLEIAACVLASLLATFASRVPVRQALPTATFLLQLRNCFAANPYSDDAFAAARLAEAHGGAVRVEEQGSVGAAFILSLPLDEPVPST